MQEVIMDKTAVYANKHRENDGLCDYVSTIISHPLPQ